MTGIRRLSFRRVWAGSIASACVWLLTLTGNFSPSYCQSWQWGQEYRVRPNETPDALVGRIGSRFYSTRFRSVPFSHDELALDIFRAPELSYEGSFTLLPRNTYIEDGELRALPDYEGFFILGQHLVLFLSAFDKNRSAQVLYGLLYDSLGQFAGMKRLAETRNASRPNKGQFKLVPAPSGKRLWLVLSHPQERNDPEEFEFYLLDDSLNTLGNRTLSLPYKDRLFEATDVLPDEEDNLYVLGKIFHEKEERQRGLPDYHFSVLKLRVTKPEEVQELILHEKEVFPTDLALARSGGQVVLCGFYAQAPGGAISGTLHFRLSSDSLRMLSMHKKAFEKDFVAEVLGEKRPPRAAALARFGLRQVIPGPDNTLYIVGEQYWMQEVCVRDARGFLYCNYYYHYNSIVVIEADSGGQIRNNYVVPKFQNSMDDEGYYLSYALAANDKGLYFVYLDNPRNRQVDTPADMKLMNRPPKADVVVARLGFDGRLTRKVLFNNESEGWILRPKFSRQTAPDELVVMAIGGASRIRMCRITLSEE